MSRSVFYSLTNTGVTLSVLQPLLLQKSLYCSKNISKKRDCIFLVYSKICECIFMMY